MTHSKTPFVRNIMKTSVSVIVLFFPVLSVSAPSEHQTTDPTEFFAIEGNELDIQSRSEFIEQNRRSLSDRFVDLDLPDENSVDPDSLLMMSKMLYHGVTIDKDRNRALDYARQAVESGSKEGVLWYRKLREQSGVEIPVKEWWRYATEGSPEAMYHLAEHYLTGKNLDYDIAFFLLSRANAKGHEKAGALIEALIDQRSSLESFESRQEQAREGSMQGMKKVLEAIQNEVVTGPNNKKEQRMRKFINRFEKDG